jgi:hypothetical protein
MGGILNFVTGIWTEISLGAGIRFHPHALFLIEAKITQHSISWNEANNVASNNVACWTNMLTPFERVGRCWNLEDVRPALTLLNL